MPISRSNKPNIAITIGDPAGVGAEVTLKALASSRISGLANFLVIGNSYVLDKMSGTTGLKLKHTLIEVPKFYKRNFSYGKIDPVCGAASIMYIDKAMALLKAGRASALVTAPINKAAVRSSGVAGFEGHTEYLAQKSGTSDFAMMFVGKLLKVTLVTRHIALRSVSGKISTDAVYRTILLTNKYLKKYFGIARPRIGVSGLNPHAGEGGMFGSEEERIIAPAVKKASRSVRNIKGPLPADVIFYDALNQKFDAVIAMYHDQGLIPFKMLYFERGVNMTLGLPFIRTSPDHGTAFDIAGKGIADPTSMIEAILLASRLAAKAR